MLQIGSRSGTVCLRCILHGILRIARNVPHTDGKKLFITGSTGCFTQRPTLLGFPLGKMSLTNRLGPQTNSKSKKKGERPARKKRHEQSVFFKKTENGIMIRSIHFSIDRSRIALPVMTAKDVVEPEIHAGLVVRDARTKTGADISVIE